MNQSIKKIFLKVLKRCFYLLRNEVLISPILFETNSIQDGVKHKTFAEDKKIICKSYHCHHPTLP